MEFWYKPYLRYFIILNTYVLGWRGLRKRKIKYPGTSFRRRVRRVGGRWSRSAYQECSQPGHLLKISKSVQQTHGVSHQRIRWVKLDRTELRSLQVHNQEPWHWGGNIDWKRVRLIEAGPEVVPGSAQHREGVCQLELVLDQSQQKQWQAEAVLRIGAIRRGNGNNLKGRKWVSRPDQPQGFGWLESTPLCLLWGSWRYCWTAMWASGRYKRKDQVQ